MLFSLCAIIEDIQNIFLFLEWFYDINPWYRNVRRQSIISRRFIIAVHSIQKNTEMKTLAIWGGTGSRL